LFVTRLAAAHFTDEPSFLSSTAAGEVDAARQVAERAMRTIAMTSERDKFNVWVALMNLENAYGGAEAEDAVMAVFKR
jgi:rRNA biogenesis protein RRP5